MILVFAMKEPMFETSTELEPDPVFEAYRKTSIGR